MLGHSSLEPMVQNPTVHMGSFCVVGLGAVVGCWQGVINTVCVRHMGMSTKGRKV